MWCINIISLLGMQTVDHALINSTGSLLIYFAILYMALVYFGHPKRFTQTMSALLGTQAILTLLCIYPVILIHHFYFGPSISAGMIMFSFLFLALLIAASIWWIAVSSFIIAEAIESSILLGLMIVVIYKVVEYYLLNILLKGNV